MSVRKDQVQISIAFLTDESKAFAKIVEENKKFIADIEKAKKSGKDLSSIIGDVAENSKKAAAVPLDKLAPTQLVTRAKQLQQIMQLIPQSAPEYAQLSGEYKKINDHLATMRARTKGVAEQAAGMGGGLGGISGGFLKMAGYIGAAIAAARGLFGIISTGIEKAADLEQTTISFEVLAGSVENAKKLVKDLYDFAAKTPFETGPINEAAKKLLAYGFSADEIVPKLKKIGDIAAAVGVPIDELAQIFGKAKLGNFIQAEELNQLADRGIPVFESLAKQLGVNVSQIKQMGSDGKITFKNLEKAFDDLSGAGGRFNGMMDKQSSTFNGLMSTMKDTTGQLLTTVFAPVAEGLKPIMQFIIEKIQFTIAEFKAWGLQASIAFAIFKDTLSAAVNNAKIYLNDLALSLEIVKLQINSFVTFDETAKKANQQGIENMKKRREELVKGYVDISEAARKARQTVIAQAKETKAGVAEVKKKGNTEAAIIDKDAAKKAEQAERERLKRIEDAIKLELAANEQKQKLLDVIYYRALSNRQMTESDYAKRGMELTRTRYANEISIYQNYLGSFKEGSQEYIDTLLKIAAAERNLDEVKAQMRRPITEVLSVLPTLPGGVSAQKSPADSILLQAEIEKSALENRFKMVVFGEQKLAIAKQEIMSEALQRVMDNADLESTIYQNAAAKKKSIDQDIYDNKKRLTDLEQKLTETAFSATSDAIQAGIELLSTDEAAKKKHASAIKALRVGEVIVSGISEVQKIWATSAQYGPLAPLIGGILTAISVARSAAAINTITATQFAKGGYTGGGTYRDSSGFRVAGVVHEGEYVAPQWMVNSPQYAPIFSMLENRRMRGFANGGFVSTTPSAISFTSAAFDPVLQELKMMRAALMQDQARPAYVVYDSISASATAVSKAKSAAQY